MSALPGIAGLVCLDTNVLLRAVLLDDPVQSPIAAEALRGLTRQNPGFITFVTLAEMYWVMTSSMGLSKDVCLTAIQRLVETETIEFDDGEGVVQALALAYEGADFPDALIHVTAQQFMSDGTVTFDRRAARRLGWRLLEAETQTA